MIILGDKRGLGTEEDGQIVRELIPRDSDNENSYLKTKKYSITIFTGDHDGAGTNSNVIFNIMWWKWKYRY